MPGPPARGPGDGQNRELAVKFKVNKFLGKGSYGSVFLVQRLVDGQQYALKEMDVRSMSQAEREDAVNEIRLLASVQHPNVTSYNEAFLDGNRLCIIMEYASEGDLAKLIKKHQMMKRPMPEDLIWKMFIQVALGLCALHNAKILHRDIKPGNIMLFEGGVAKIGDLGIAKLLTRTAAAKTQIGTPHYMPPEIWRNRPYGFSSDTWAMGCLLYELATLNVPFEARSMSELRYKVLRGTYPPVPSTFSRDLQQLVRECLDPNPDKRPSMDQILNTQAVRTRMSSVPVEGRAPPATAGSAMLETIKVPRNFQMIKGKLPPAQYATDMPAMNMPHHGPHNMETIEEGSEEGTNRGSAAAPAYYNSPPAGGGYPPKNPPAHLATPVQPPLYQQQQSQQQQARAAEKLPQVAPRGGYSEPPVAPMPGGGYGQPRRVQPAPLQTPQSDYVPFTPQGGPPPWGAPHGQKSESHAKYGAFYHDPSYTPKQQTPQGPPMPSPWLQKQQQQAPPLYHQSPQQPQYKYPPYAGAGGAIGSRAQQDVRLPALPGAPQAGRAAAAGLGKPPPWNYGARDKSFAQMTPYQQQQHLAQQAQQQPQGRSRPAQLPALHNGGVGGEGGGGEVSRYPPPQWAPQPRR